MHKELNIFLAFSSHSTVNKETVPFNFFLPVFLLQMLNRLNQREIGNGRLNPERLGLPIGLS